MISSKNLSANMNLIEFKPLIDELVNNLAGKEYNKIEKKAKWKYSYLSSYKSDNRNRG